MALHKFANRSARDSRPFKIVMRPKGAVKQNSLSLAQLCQELRLELGDRWSQQNASSRHRVAHHVEKTAGAMIAPTVLGTGALDFNSLILQSTLFSVTAEKRLEG